MAVANSLLPFLFISSEPPKKKMTVEDVLAMFEVDPIRVNIREMYPGIKCQAPHNGNMCVFDVEDENMKVVVAEDLVPCDACKKKIKHMLSARVVVRDIINGDKVRPKENNHGEDEG